MHEIRGVYEGGGMWHLRGDVAQRGGALQHTERRAGAVTDDKKLAFLTPWHGRGVAALRAQAARRQRVGVQHLCDRASQHRVVQRRLEEERPRQLAAADKEVRVHQCQLHLGAFVRAAGTRWLSGQTTILGDEA